MFTLQAMLSQKMPRVRISVTHRSSRAWRARANIERYGDVKAQYDVRVSAAFAAAFVALKATPDKVSPIVKGIMNGIKVCLEERARLLRSRAS